MRDEYPPALLYHKVGNAWEVGITWVRAGEFGRQMLHLHGIGWIAVSLGDALDASNGGEGQRRFLLAFDDGYECVHQRAFPVLSELAWPAATFMPSGYIGRWNDWDHQLLGRRFRHLSADELREQHRSGWTVGSHGITHTDLTQLDNPGLRRELVDSKKRLEDLLGASVTWLAFPFGRYNQRVIDESASAGYTGAVTTTIRNIRLPEGYRVLPAFPVYRWDSIASVGDLVNYGGVDRLRRKARQWATMLNSGTLLWKALFSRDHRRAVP
jgi:peptidoglycan/xylan/chitin deacetylase (PgdA/CDA1 family)